MPARRLYLRVERQTLRRLPQSGAILFGIRVHSYEMARAITTPEAASGLAEAVRALPEATAHYKSLRAYGPALLAWLDAARSLISQSRKATIFGWSAVALRIHQPIGKLLRPGDVQRTNADHPGSSSARANVSVTSAIP